MKLRAITGKVILTIKNSVFLKKMILTYILCSCFVFLGFTFFIISLINNNFMNSINQLNDKALMQSANTCSVTLENLYNYYYVDTLENADLIKLLYSSQYQNSLSISSSRIRGKLLNYSNLVKSFYIINLKGNFICSNLDTYKNSKSFFDQDILSLLANRKYSDQIFLYQPRDVNYSISQNKYSEKYISLIFRKFDTGYLVINLNYEKFSEMINYNSYNRDSQTLVISNQGFVLADSNSSLFGQNLSSDPLYNELLKQPQNSGSYISRLDGSKKLINYRKDEMFGIVYMTITQYQLFDSSNTLLVQALLYSLIAVLISLIMIFSASWVLYKPINELKNSIRNDRISSGAKKDEFRYISSSFETIEKDFRIMKKNSDAYFITTQKQLLKDLLTGSKPTVSIPSAGMESENMRLNKNSLVIVNITFDNYDCLINDKNENMPLLRYAVENIFQELLPNHYVSEMVDFKNYLAFIINFNASPVPENYIAGDIYPHFQSESLKLRLYDLEEALNQLKETVYQYFTIDVSCSLGTVVNALSDISESYQSALTVNLYRTKNGTDKLLYYDDLSFLSPEEQQYPIKQEKLILDDIRNGDEEKLVHHMEELFDILYHYYYNNVILYLLTFYNALERMEAKCNITYAESKSNISATVLQSEKIYRLKDIYLERCLNSLRLYQEIKTHNAIKTEIIKQITEIIDKNIANSNLSVDTIADEVHLSNSYLRNIFKELTGNTLSNYIIERRLEQICRLLKDTDLSVQKIADQLGFSSRNYVFTFFKNYMGITPNQYRMQYKSTTDTSI